MMETAAWLGCQSAQCAADLDAVRLTLKLAAVVTVLLMLVATPLAWWLARTRSRLRPAIGALVALPMVLPPTVLGFYLLVAFAPDGLVGRLAAALGLGQLTFSFAGLVLASILYSLPFAVQPLQNAFEAIGTRALEAAATLRAGPWDSFWSVAVPLARPGFVSATVLGFAHTIGEFGVILMIGGSIPNETRVASVQIYDHVEALAYTQAHWLAGGMLAFSFVVLFSLYTLYPQGLRGGRR